MGTERDQPQRRPPHLPVMLREVVEALRPRPDAIVVDGTFGAGGYSVGLLEAASCRVWGLDRDPDAIAAGESVVRRYGGRLALREGRFGEMEAILASDGIEAVDGVTLDLGVSSMQLDRADRGFSFQSDGPLDMRMERAGPSAADLVNELEEPELADVLWRYGDERRSRRIARAIVAARREAPIETTGHLAAIVRRAVGPAGRGDRIDPATRSFQALRIVVNDELGELRRGLAAAERLLVAGGRLAVVAFHSLEDRILKEFLRERSGSLPRGSRHLPDSSAADSGAGRLPTFSLVGRQPQRPSSEEAARNPRARSARLRAAERTTAAAWSSVSEGASA